VQRPQNAKGKVVIGGEHRGHVVHPGQDLAGSAPRARPPPLRRRTARAPRLQLATSCGVWARTRSKLSLLISISLRIGVGPQVAMSSVPTASAVPVWPSFAKQVGGGVDAVDQWVEQSG
jgi:hypothetical protein